MSLCVYEFCVCACVYEFVSMCVCVYMLVSAQLRMFTFTCESLL